MTAYVGIPVPEDEAHRLLNTASLPTKVLNIHDLDKGVVVLGIECKVLSCNLWAPFKKVEESIAIIRSAERMWKDEVLRIGMNLSNVTIEYMEDGTEVVSYPDPILIVW
jgi:hypothetical protein